MKLYKIMLVDDEEEVRLSIIKKMEWEKLGFCVVGDAENGEEALEKIEQLDPDVVMTDIKMPYMDGLALAEKIRQKYPSKKIMIFSGFDDFEYAKEAIRLGVSEYILKPVNIKELSTILLKVKEKLDIEISERRDIDKLRAYYNANIPIIREQFLNNLLHSKLEYEDIENKLKEYDIDILNAKKYIIAGVDIEYNDIDKNMDFAVQKELIPISVRDILEDILKKYYRCKVFTSLINSKIVMIIAIDENNTQTDLSDILKDICKEVQRTIGVPITIGLGNSQTDISSLETSYNAALDALGYKRIVGSGEVIYINDVEPDVSRVLKFEEIEEDKLVSAAKFGPIEKIDLIIEEISNKLYMAKVHSRQQQAYMLSIINSIIKLMQQYEISLSNFSPSSNDYMDILEKTKDIDEFKTWLKDICYDIKSRMEEKRESTGKKIVKEAKAYINENYQNPELSVEMLCRHLHMSTAYFSTLFKKETGQTYIAYLTDVRLGKAVELLNTTDKKTYMIAELVGYQEQNYFSYVFKKKFGVSPTRYKNNKEN